ncbi:MAG: acyl-[acyl-carrier-protein]--UDP-N-acetylglucosamine O-acyltransferase [Coxiella sp. (in: Bacteria)]|nr:MAG: acyl-[acyl-carrier-protein]--UDP-N-acetylglucosamine O-acyltransferase [Coxiella sp. (in: g-proteobacteria)]
METVATTADNSVIASTAVISSSAKIGRNVRIGHYAIVEGHVVIGDGCVLNQHAIVRRYTILKENVFVDSFAVVGADNQDLKFDPSVRSGTIIGANTKIREGVTIHRASHEGDNTIVGDNCLIMGNAHIAHDCILGDNVILANGALLAGHIVTQSHCILSGGAVFHQFIRIGHLSMTSGNAAIGLDVPPFVMALERNQVKGLNVIGMKRAGFTHSDLQDLKNLYRLIMAARGNAADLAAKVRSEGQHGQSRAGQIFLAFFEEASTRGYLRAY